MGYCDATSIAFRDMMRRERQHRNWTQTKLAQEMTKRGIPTSWPAVNKIENGHRNVTLSEAAAIADIFGVTITRMIGAHSRPKADRDFALRRLHESVTDTQRAIKTSIRDTHTSLTQLTEVAALVDQDIINTVRTAIEKLDAENARLAEAGGKIAQARGGHAAWSVKAAT